MPTAAGVYLSLNETALASNSYVDANDIGVNETALLCHTDKMTCCTNENGQIRAGQWYFPNGTSVGFMGASHDEFYRDRGTQVVRLHHREGMFTERGPFQCTIPDANDIMQNISINIGMLSILLSEKQ